MKPLTRNCLSTLLTLAVCGGAAVPAMAGGVRSSAQTSVNSAFNPNYNPNVNANYNPNVNANYNPNASPIYNPNALAGRNAPASSSAVTRSGSSAAVEGGSQGGCCYQSDYTPPTVAGVTIPAPATGSILASNPPDCTTVVVNEFIYRKCGTVWYQPQMSGTTTTYVVVDSPQ